MANTRVIPTSIGKADFNFFENVQPGELFLDADGVEEEDATSIAEAVESHAVWVRLKSKGSDSAGPMAVALGSGSFTTFKDDRKVIILHQRNMWELWA